MLKKRLIFTLLYSEGNFQLSRNFQLQNVGNLDWLYTCFNLESITNSIDELVILNVEREEQDEDRFLEAIKELATHCFMPLAVGGGIRTKEQVSKVLKAGADKVVMNYELFNNVDVVKDITDTFGKQVLVASVDFLREGDELSIFTNAGTEKLDLNFETAIHNLNKLGIGELYLTSIEKDGTGQGFDFDALELAANNCDCPIIASGGVGNFKHLKEGLDKEYINAVSTANIFNFLASGLTEARDFIISQGIPMAKWDRDKLKSLRVDQ